MLRTGLTFALSSTSAATKRDVFEPTMHADARGAKILVITDPRFSQAAEVADPVLPVTVDVIGPFDSVVPATAIVESLVAGKLGERADRRIREAMNRPRALCSTEHVPSSGRACPCSRVASRG